MYSSETVIPSKDGVAVGVEGSSPTPPRGMLRVDPVSHLPVKTEMGNARDNNKAERQSLGGKAELEYKLLQTFKIYPPCCAVRLGTEPYALEKNIQPIMQFNQNEKNIYRNKKYMLRKD